MSKPDIATGTEASAFASRMGISRITDVMLGHKVSHWQKPTKRWQASRRPAGQKVGVGGKRFAQGRPLAGETVASKPTKRWQARKKIVIFFPFWLAESSRLACRVFAATLPMAHPARRACLLLPLDSPLHPLWLADFVSLPAASSRLPCLWLTLPEGLASYFRWTRLFIHSGLLTLSACLPRLRGYPAYGSPCP
jgi:hypothetical protein